MHGRSKMPHEERKSLVELVLGKLPVAGRPLPVPFFPVVMAALYFALSEKNALHGRVMLKNAARQPLCFEIDNYKVNHLAGPDPGEEGSQVKMVPITRGLLRLLKEELEWRKYVGTPHFLLGPESKLRRKTMWEGASRAFGHFWGLTGYAEVLELNDLRNTFITRLTMAYPEHAKVISDHASIEVIKRHYTDQKLLSAVIQHFAVFE